MPRLEVTNHRLEVYDTLERFKLFEEDIAIDHDYRMLTRYSTGRLQARAHEVTLMGIDRSKDHPSVLSLILTNSEEPVFIRPNIQDGYLSVLGPQLHANGQWATQGYLINPAVMHDQQV